MAQTPQFRLKERSSFLQELVKFTLKMYRIHSLRSNFVKFEMVLQAFAGRQMGHNWHL